MLSRVVPGVESLVSQLSGGVHLFSDGCRVIQAALADGRGAIKGQPLTAVTRDDQAPRTPRVKPCRTAHNKPRNALRCARSPTPSTSSLSGSAVFATFLSNISRSTKVGLNSQVNRQKTLG